MPQHLDEHTCNKMPQGAKVIYDGVRFNRWELKPAEVFESYTNRHPVDYCPYCGRNLYNDDD